MENKQDKLVIIYSHAEQDEQLTAKLLSHLSILQRQGLVRQIWHRGMIPAGEEAETALQRALGESDIIVSLISNDYFDEFFNLLEDSLHREDEGKAEAFAIVLRDCLWEEYPLLQGRKVLPPEGKPINSRDWDSADQPFRKVAEYLLKYLRREEGFISESASIKQDKGEAVQQPAAGYQPPGREEIRHFTDSLLRRLEGLDRETHWNPGDYLHINALAQLQKGKSFQKKAVPLDKAVLNNKAARSFLVIGEPGAGKSVALRELARKLLKAGGQQIPLYINLRDWYTTENWTPGQPPTPQSLERFVLQSLREGQPPATREFIMQHFRELYRSGRFFFLFDSFDETPAVIDSYEHAPLIDKLSEVIYLYGLDGGNRLLLASREFKRPTGRFAADVSLHIRPLAVETVIESLEKTGFSQEALKKLYNHHNLRPLISNPFSLSLVKDYLKNNAEQLPPNQLALYESCIQYRLNPDVLEEEFRLSPAEVIRTARAIAAFLFEDPRYGLTVELQELNRKLKGYPLNATIKLLRDQRLARLGKGRFSFIHRKFHEYFVALNFREQPEQLPVEDIPLDARNRDALVLYCEIAEEATARQVVDYCWEEAQKLSFDPSPDEQWLLQPGLSRKERQKRLPKAQPRRIIIDDQYYKSVNCLRFLIDGFISRKEMLEPYYQPLSSFILANVELGDDLILKKFLIESIALLPQEEAERLIVRIFDKITTTPNPYLQESLANASRYLGELSTPVLQHLVRFYFLRTKPIGYPTFKEAKVLELSDNFRPLARFLKVREIEKWIFLAGIILAGIYLLAPWEGAIEGWQWMVPVLLMEAALFIFIVIPWFSITFLSYMFWLSDAKTKGLMGTIVGFLIVYFVFISQMGSMDIGFLEAPDEALSAGSKVAVWLYHIIIVLGLVLGIVSIIYTSFLGFMEYLRDLPLFRKARRELGRNTTRIMIAGHFRSLRSPYYRKKYVRLLRELEIKPSGEWPDGKPPYEKDDEPSGMLAQLEERWRGLG
ncbi:MAG: NACHT domain-containing protein [Phaeodactylibacter sp.]|nr:NACHT domain-containing protein [Phaeodactylibacter sp.]MCB9265231.1 NACHT domain-containing protein [Lewinellaceae bacterium]